MRKPSFEAKYYGDIHELHISIEDPVDEEGGEFSGYEILKKVGSPFSEKEWQTEVSLPAAERDYEMDGLQPLVTYAVTVRGRFSPNVYTPLADALEFEVLHPGPSSFYPLLVCFCPISSDSSINHVHALIFTSMSTLSKANVHARNFFFFLPQLDNHSFCIP